MSLKSDCLDSKKGNVAAIKRLRSFILFCKSSLDEKGLNALLLNKCILNKEINEAKAYIANSKKRVISNQQSIRKFSSYLNQVEYLLSKKDNNNALPILNEMSKMRWSIIPNQDFYNKDAKFIQIVQLLKKAGVDIKI